MHTMKLFPFEKVRRSAEQVMNQGGTIHQQFNCQRCGTKQTMAEPNRFFAKGKCEECGHETNLVKAGCNFMARFSIGDAPPRQRQKGDH